MPPTDVSPDAGGSEEYQNNFAESADDDSQHKRRRYEDETDDRRRERSDRSKAESEESEGNSKNRRANYNPEDLELRVLIDPQFVGALIGRSGSNITRLREESGSFINMIKPSHDSIKERVMVVKGPDAKLVQILSSVAATQIETFASREAKYNGAQGGSPSSTEIRLLIHRVVLGAIIGKGGETIKATQEETHCKIQISKETLGQSTEKSVTLSGSASEIAAGLARVIDQIKSNPPKAGAKLINYVPQGFSSHPPRGPPAHPSGNYAVAGGAGYPHHPPPHASHYPHYPPPPHHGHAPNPLTDGPLSEQKIAIPSVCAGCVIGKNGVTIRDLRERSQCNIIVEKEDPSAPNERIVIIRGTAAGINSAVNLIRQCVESYRPPQLQQ